MEKKELKKICGEILNIIDQTNNSTVYDNIITFFTLKSQLHDRLDEIQNIPVKQTSPTLWIRMFHRSKAEEMISIICEQERQKHGLCQSILQAGRQEFGYNRTKEGETVTKDNVFFGGICGLNTLPITKWEECKKTDPTVYNTIASQMTRFVKSYELAFKLVYWF